MRKIFFVLNKITDFDFHKHIEKYLSEYEIAIGETVPQNPEEYALIVLWNYRKIIPINSNYKNYIIFHSSDLPNGKGWAPIYYALAKKQKYYTITGIFANEKVDSGDIIVKAKFEIRDNYTARYLRMWDEEIMILLTQKILQKYSDKKIYGTKQKGKESYYERRTRENNEICIDDKIIDIIPHLRACEENAPAFIIYNNVKYIISIEPNEKIEFPNDLEIIFADEM